jgi:hypothetical protein
MKSKFVSTKLRLAFAPARAWTQSVTSVLALATWLASTQAREAAMTNNWSGCGDQPCPGTIDPISPILYFGGPLLTGATPTRAGGGPTVYVIWYGNWNQNNGTDTPEGQQLVYDFLYGLSVGPDSAYGSPYFNIVTTYSTNSSAGVLFSVNGKIAFGGSCSVGYLYGSSLDAQNRDVAGYTICGTTPPLLPNDSNGIYLVLTSSDVDVTIPGPVHFCSRVCGAHSGSAANTLCGNNIKVAWGGNPASCLTKCAGQNVGPNGNAGVDGLINIIAHELAETITDPEIGGGTAWSGIPSGDGEVGDKCAWTFGQNLPQLDFPHYGRPYYNVTLPSPNTGPGAPAGYRNYLLQRLLAHGVTVNGVTGDFCAVSYDPTTGAITQ